jgi:hypothetical protein
MCGLAPLLVWASSIRGPACAWTCVTALASTAMASATGHSLPGAGYPLSTACPPSHAAQLPCCLHWMVEGCSCNNAQHFLLAGESVQSCMVAAVTALASPRHMPC